METVVFIAESEEQAEQLICNSRERIQVRNERGAAIGTVERMWREGCKVMAVLDCVPVGDIQ